MFFIFGIIYYYFYKIFIYDKLQYLNTVKESLSFSIFLLTCTFLRIYPLYMVTLYVGNDAFFVNSFIWNIELFILIIVLGILLGSYDYFSNNKLPILDILPLILTGLLGLFLLLKSNNLIVLYFSIEIQSIVLYILIASKKFSLYTIEASLKYFIFSISLTLILLFGIALIYSELGTVDFIELNLIFAHPLESSFIIKIGIYFILFGLLLKLAIFPFHGWIADIYLGANLVSITFTAIVPKIVFIAVLIKFFFLFSFFKFELTIVLNVLGIISILIGTLIGLYESKILRLIAFSSMVNIGHILISISLDSIEGIVAGCYMMLIYSVLTLGIFIILMSYRSHEGWELKFITNLVEMVNSNKLIALTFALLMLSLAGIPPLAGFCGKFLFFIAILKQGEYLYAIILSILNVITAIYYLRTIRFIYFTNQKQIVNFKNLPISIVTSFCLSLILFFNFLLFFFQAPLLLFLTNLILITFY